MKKIKYCFLFFFISSIFFSCSSKKEILYLQKSSNLKNWSVNKYDKLQAFVQVGDILKIDVLSVNKEVALVYNELTNKNLHSIDLMKINGYLVDNNGNIDFPVLGDIKVSDLDVDSISILITSMLKDDNHLISPVVNVRRLNSKFTVLGEVNNPGTFSYYDDKLNIFQALGYANDLSIYAKRNDVKIIREYNGVIKTNEINLTDANILKSEFYYIRNNDIIIINPSFNKVKSAGFIGSPSSIASLASLILSITLIIINN